MYSIIYTPGENSASPRTGSLKRDAELIKAASSLSLIEG